MSHNKRPCAFKLNAEHLLNPFVDGLAILNDHHAVLEYELKSSGRLRSAKDSSLASATLEQLHATGTSKMLRAAVWTTGTPDVPDLILSRCRPRNLAGSKMMKRNAAAAIVTSAPLSS